MSAAFQGKCPFSGATGEFKMRPQEPKYLRLKNWVEDTQAVDTLHQKATNVSDNTMTEWEGQTGKYLVRSHDLASATRSLRHFGLARVNPSGTTSVKSGSMFSTELR